MKRILITFSGHAYDRTTQLIVERAPRYGVDEVRVYDDRWLLSTEFYEQNKAWWSRPDTKYGLPNRGFGWFIWKPYIILHALSRCQPGDIVLYVDADTYPIADLSPLYQECERIGGVMLFEAQGCEHQHWCKRDTFVVMGQDEDRWRFRPHAVARFMLFRNCVGMPHGHKCSKYFLDDWQRYCLDTHANSFDPSVLAPEYPELREPRCEQAILTNLAHKYGHKLYREACGFGSDALALGVDAELYGQLFHQDGRHGNKSDMSGSRWRNVY